MSCPQSTLVLMVTCSRDETRRDLAIKVMQNISELAPRASLADRLLVFDNASTFDDHLRHVPPGAIVCRSQTNLGYWTAIKWVLEHRAELLPPDLRYLYIVESDLWHSDLRPLANCEALLDSDHTVSCVRTQEFSVRWRWRFDKRLKFLPGHVTRLEIALRNAVSGEAAWFRPVAGANGLFLSNLHAKLPALNRLATLDVVFAELALMKEFTEGDFFRLTMRHHPLIGIYDGGLFHSLISRDDRASAISGSYSDASSLTSLGYQPTRSARMLSTTASVSISGGRRTWV